MISSALNFVDRHYRKFPFNVGIEKYKVLAILLNTKMMTGKCSGKYCSFSNLQCCFLIHLSVLKMKIWIYSYILLNKNWKFTGLVLGRRICALCEDWSFDIFALFKIFNNVAHSMIPYIRKIPNKHLITSYHDVTII